MKKLLVTSGCSYSAYGGDWPFLLKHHYNYDLYNLALPSVGNDWIYRSVVYGVNTALKQGIQPKDIIVSVLWTHVDRKSFYITKKDTPNWELLINELFGTHLHVRNPANFLEIKFGTHGNDYVHTGKPVGLPSAWIVGNAAKATYPDANKFLNKVNELDKYKIPYYENFHTEEGLFLETIENILGLQWFCKAMGITLINQSYIDLFYYPEYDFFNSNEKRNHITTTYPHLSYLYDMIDFSTWVPVGLHEFTRNHNLGFPDTVHPSNIAHRKYTNEILIPKFNEVVTV